MKVKKVAVTAAVCAALLGSQGVMAEEQPIGTEGMDFAFDDAQVSSVEMSELSGTEMEETEGSRWYAPMDWGAGAITGAYGGWDGYNDTASEPTWSGAANSAFTGAAGGAVSGFSSPGPYTAAGSGYAGGYAAGAANGAGQNLGWW